MTALTNLLLQVTSTPDDFNMTPISEAKTTTSLLQFIVLDIDDAIFLITFANIDTTIGSYVESAMLLFNNNVWRVINVIKSKSFNEDIFSLPKTELFVPSKETINAYNNQIECSIVDLSLLDIRIKNLKFFWKM